MRLPILAPAPVLNSRLKRTSGPTCLLVLYLGRYLGTFATALFAAHLDFVIEYIGHDVDHLGD